MGSRHANLMRANGIKDEDTGNERTQVISQSAEDNGTKHPLERYLGKFSRYKINIDNFNDICNAIYEALKKIGKKNQFEDGMNAILGQNGQNLIAMIRRHAPRNCYNIAAIELDLRTQVGSILLPSRPKRDKKELLLAWTTKRDNIQREISDLLLPLIPEKERVEDVDCEGKTGIPDDPNEFTRQAIAAVQKEGFEEVVAVVDLETRAPNNDQTPKDNGDTAPHIPTMPSARVVPAPKLGDRESNPVTVAKSRTRRTNAFSNTKRLGVPLLGGVALGGLIFATVATFTTESQRADFYNRIQKVLHLK